MKKRLRRYIGGAQELSRRIFPPQDKGGFRALVYHSVTDKLIADDRQENTVPRDLFKRQMDYLARNGYNLISASAAVGALAADEALPNKTVALSFDDAYSDFTVNALPVLKQYKFCATLFVAVHLLRDYSGDERYSSCAQIRGLRDCALVDFGCHGLTHRALSVLNPHQMDEEIVTGKERLEDLTQSRVELFAYPFGHSRSYNQKAIEKIKAAGFRAAFTTIFGMNCSGCGLFLLRRNRISWMDETAEFGRHLRGAYDWCAFFERLRKKRYI